MKITTDVRTANDSVEAILLTDSKVFIRTNITAIDEPGTEEMPGFKGYSYDEAEYTKDEFIVLQSQQVQDLSSAVDDLLILVPEIASLGGAE